MRLFRKSLISTMTDSFSPTGLQAHAARLAGFGLVASYAFFPTFLAPWGIAIVAVLAFWLLAGGLGARWRAVRGMPVVWITLALFTVLVLWSLHPTADREYIGVALRKYAKLLLIPVAISLLVEDVWRRRCMNAFLLAMLFILLSVYVGIWIPLPWARTQETGWNLSRMVVGDYLTQGVMLSFFIVLALDRGLHRSRPWIRAFWWAVAALASFSVICMNQGRTGYLLFAMGIGSYVLVSLRGRARWGGLAALVLAVAVVAVSSAGIRERVDLALVEAQQSDNMEITSIGGRVNFWKGTIRMIAERPVTGWGTGSYHSQWCAHVGERHDWCAFGNWHPHNQFLFFWMETGLAGVLLYAALVLTPLWAARRAPRELRGLLVSFSVIFLFDSLINAAMWSARESHFFSFMIALLLAEAAFRGRAAPPPAAA